MWAIRVSGPVAQPRLGYFARLCRVLRWAVFVIVGHPRRMPPLLAHGHAGAILPRVLCPVLRWWNWGHRCLSPALAHNHAGVGVKAG